MESTVAKTSARSHNALKPHGVDGRTEFTSDTPRRGAVYPLDR
jgi:hypothetical protein